MNIQTTLQWLIPFISFFAGVIGILLNFKGLFNQMRTGDASPLILVLVTFLCGAYGIERFANATQLAEQLQRIQDTVAQSSGGRVLNSRDKVYSCAAQAIGLGTNRIRVVLLASRPPTPEPVLDTIVKTLKTHEAMRYEGVFIINSKKIPLEFAKSNIPFFTKLKKAGVYNRCSFYILENQKPVCFDTLIVDKKCVGIGFTRTEKENDLQSAIFFENQPEMAEQFADWFDHVIKPQTKSYDAWLADLEQHPSK